MCCICCIIVFVHPAVSVFVFINTKHINIFFVVCVGRAVVEEVDCACCLWGDQVSRSGSWERTVVEEYLLSSSSSSSSSSSPALSDSAQSFLLARSWFMISFVKIFIVCLHQKILMVGRWVLRAWLGGSQTPIFWFVYYDMLEKCNWVSCACSKVGPRHTPSVRACTFHIWGKFEKLGILDMESKLGGPRHPPIVRGPIRPYPSHRPPIHCQTKT